MQDAEPATDQGLDEPEIPMLDVVEQLDQDPLLDGIPAVDEPCERAMNVIEPPVEQAVLGEHIRCQRHEIVPIERLHPSDAGPNVAALHNGLSERAPVGLVHRVASGLRDGESGKEPIEGE
jgi:hypothetical protein